MSFWAKLGIKITDLDVFESVCQQHNVELERKSGAGMGTVAQLKDKLDGPGRLNPVLKQAADGSYSLEYDADPNYGRLIHRLGRNLDVLMRDYAEQMVRKQARKNGMVVSSTQEQPDGSIVMKMAV